MIDSIDSQLPCVCGSRLITRVHSSRSTEWRCSGCDVLLGGGTNAYIEQESTGVLPLVFSQGQWVQGLAGTVLRTLRYPIQPKRWRRNGHADRFIRALRERAPTQAPHVPLSRLIREVSRTALTIILPRMPQVAVRGFDLEPASWDQWQRTIRRLINEEVTRDLLGNDWRSSDRVREQPSTARAEFEASLRVQELLRHPLTTPGEFDVMRTFVEEDGDIHLIAQRLHCTPEAVRQHLYRIKTKQAS
jgi:hypothetical protein